MRLTYTDLLTQFLNNIKYPGSTDTTIIDYFDRALGACYQTTLAFLDTYVSQEVKTAETVADQQYYHNPAGISKIESMTVTVGSIAYPLTPIDSQLNWDRINEILISTSAIPQFFFPRRDDFGIWPIPQDAYTITLNRLIRDRNLTVADYTTGDVTVTNDSQTVTGNGTAFTSAMVGRWFTVTTDGYWYRISAVSSGTELTLETSFEGTGASGLDYRIGESPELPEEGHILLVYGTTSEYYAGPRSDIASGEYWNNMYWTGDGTNKDRKLEGVKGGLLGLKMSYASRSSSKIVRRRPHRTSRSDKLWGTTLS